MKKAAVFCVLFCATYSVAQTNSAPAGVFSADQEESPAGAGNGIAMSMQKCASQTHVCQIVAPAVYSLTENGIWGLLDPLARQIQPFGPKATDPIGCVTDLRYGGPRWLCNGGGPDPGDPSLINGPMFSMNTNRLRTGPYAAAPPSLTLTDTVFAGGHDFYYDEAESEALRIQIESHTPTSSQPIRANQRKYSPGDNLGLVLNTVGVGIGLRQNEGHELVHGRAGEMPEVYDGSITSVSCAPSGDCTFALSASRNNSSWALLGEGLPLIDLTHADTTGYIASIKGNLLTGSSDVDWPTLGTSAVTTTTAAVSDERPPGTNTFPRSNQVVPVASTTGFGVGQVACLFDSSNPTWECSKITAVGPGSSITIAAMHYPMSGGSTVAAGGATGYGLSLDADSTTSANGKALDPDYSPTSGTTIRIVYPVIGSDASTRTIRIMSGWAGAADANFQSYAYSRMGGSGGSIAPTVSGATVTACTASGGSGYTAASGAPPQIVVSASPAWTTYPILTVSDSGGVLSGCRVVSGGTRGSGGTLNVSIVPSNPYHLFPQAKAWQVWNPATGGVDGLAVQTTALAGTFANGDSIEQAHYFANKELGFTMDNWTYQTPGSHSNLNVYTAGNFAINDYEAQFTNASSPTAYWNYPGGATPWNIYSAGTLGTPRGLTMRGPHSNGLEMVLPPYGGFDVGALFIDCRDVNTGNHVCGKWNETYPVIGVRNQNANQTANDIFGYNPVTQIWSLTAGATSTNGANPSCTLNFGPNGISTAGSGCSGSQAAGSSMPGGRPDIAGTTGSIGGSPLQAGACASGTAGIPGATTSMAIVVTPATYPGDGIFWQGYVSAANTVTVKVCAAVTGAPAASVYNVRAIP